MMMGPRIAPLKKYTQNEKTKRLQWARIMDNKITDDSVWKNLKEDKFDQPELRSDLESIFAMKAPAVKQVVAAPEKVSNKPTLHFIDAKLAQNVMMPFKIFGDVLFDLGYFRIRDIPG